MALGFSDAELAAALPYGGWQPQLPTPPSPQALFNIPAPTPTTNYFGRSGRGSNQYTQISQYQKLRQEQEQKLQAQNLAQYMAGVDPFQDDYPYKRFEAINRFPLAPRAPEGAARLQAFDTAYQQGNMLKKAADAQIQEQQSGQFVQALINAETAEELDALASANPNLAAKFNTILSQRAKKFAPSSRDPDRDRNYWIEQALQARRAIDDPLTTPETRALAEEQFSFARSKYDAQTPSEPAAKAAPQWQTRVLSNGKTVRILVE